jgi:hypothetical protein
MSSFFSIPIPVPSQAEIKRICKKQRHIGLLYYGKNPNPLNVYYYPWEDAYGKTYYNNTIPELEKDMILVEWNGKWFMQKGGVTIEDSLKALLNTKNPVVFVDPFLMTHTGRNWHGRSLSIEEIATLNTNLWSDYWLGGKHKEIRRLEASVIIKYKQIKPSLQGLEDKKLYLKYDEYIHAYSSLVNDPKSSARERNYYRMKSLYAAQTQSRGYVDEILHCPGAVHDAHQAFKPIGELEEDWEWIEVTD